MADRRLLVHSAFFALALVLRDRLQIILHLSRYSGNPNQTFLENRELKMVAAQITTPIIHKSE
jgi:hypothetical protein